MCLFTSMPDDARKADSQDADGDGADTDGADTDSADSDIDDNDAFEKWEQHIADTECKVVDLGNACWIHKHFSEDIQTRQVRCLFVKKCTQ
jgi:hypothetical protein